jgi:hypothetical protein
VAKGFAEEAFFVVRGDDQRDEHFSEV